MQAYAIASIASGVHERTVRAYVADYLNHEGFFSPCNWGRNQKVPTFFEDETIKHMSRVWWRNHGARRGP